MNKTQKASRNELIKGIDKKAGVNKKTDRKKYQAEYSKEDRKTRVKDFLYFSFYGENNPDYARFMKIKGKTKMDKLMYMLEIAEDDARVVHHYDSSRGCIKK